MLGIIFSIIAGIAMSIQGVFNTRLSEKIGVWETSTIVQGSAFIIALIVMWIFGKGNIMDIRSANKLYLLGGVLGVIITFTVMMGIADLGPTYSIATILVAQLLAAAAIDAFGLFSSEKIPFSLHHFLGVGIMILGIIIFKWNR